MIIAMKVAPAAVTASATAKPQNSSAPTPIVFRLTAAWDVITRYSVIVPAMALGA